MIGKGMKDSRYQKKRIIMTKDYQFLVQNKKKEY